MARKASLIVNFGTSAGSTRVGLRVSLGSLLEVAVLSVFLELRFSFNL